MGTDTFEVVRKADPFTRLDNGIFRDRRLSMKARGLLCTCLSLPPDWNFSVRGLSTLCSDKRTAIESALDELEAAGYLYRSRCQEHKENGTFGGTAYTFYEVARQPCAENQHTVDAEPCVDFPHADNPHAENQQQENNKQETKEQESPPTPRRGRAAKKAPDHLPDEFDRLWKAYPRGDDKQGAIREWDRLRPDEATVYAMKLALMAQKQSDEWQRGIGIPYFVRWLSHRRWEDERIRSGPEAEPARSHEEVARW